MDVHKENDMESLTELVITVLKFFAIFYILICISNAVKFIKKQIIDHNFYMREIAQELELTRRYRNE